VCVKYHDQAKLEPLSSIIASHVIGLCHPIHEVSCGVLCICIAGLGGSHLWKYLALSFPVLAT
jgi:hypothetical protein